MGRQHEYCVVAQEDCGLNVTANCPALISSGRVNARLVKKLPPVEASAVPSDTVEVIGRVEIVVPPAPEDVQTSTRTSSALMVVVAPSRAVSMRVRLNAVVVEKA